MEGGSGERAAAPEKRSPFRVSRCYRLRRGSGEARGRSAPRRHQRGGTWLADDRFARMPLVRWSVEPLEARSRTLLERLALAAPRVAQALGRFMAGRPAGSRARRALITRLIRVGFAANSRLDYKAMCAFYDPAVEIRLTGGGTRIDLDPVYWGHEGLRKVNDDWKAGFDEFRFEPREAIDPGGDRFGVLVESRGQTSGIVTRELNGFVIVLRGGLAMRQDFYWEGEAAVEALRTRAD
jgi:hypothetical protein